MPELTVKQIEEKFQLKEGSLKTLVEEDKPIETEVIHFFTEKEKNELVTNSENAGHGRGRKAEKEIAFKDYKKENPDITGDDFITHIANLKALSKEQIEAASKEVFNNDKAKEFLTKIASLEEDKTTLQKTIETKETLFNTQLAEERGKIRTEQIKTQANNYFSQLDFEVPKGLDDNEEAKFLSRQVLNNTNLFLTEHQLKDEDGKRVWYKGEKPQQTDTLEPLDDETVISNWAKENYLKVTPRIGRGGKGTKVNTAITGIVTVEDFQKYCKENNIPENSEEQTALWRKFKEKIK